MLLCTQGNPALISNQRYKTMKDYRRLACNENPHRPLYRHERPRLCQQIIAESHKRDHWARNEHNAGKTYYLESIIEVEDQPLTYCWTADEKNAYQFCPPEKAIAFVEKHFTGKDEKTLCHMADCTGDWRW